jgi:hypothetical protein
LTRFARGTAGSGFHWLERAAGWPKRGISTAFRPDV